MPIIDGQKLIAAAPIDAGYEFLEANNGQEALAILKAQPVDLLITDKDMPEMDGLKLIAAVREQFPETWIILCTSGLNGNPPDGVIFFGKPINLRLLAQIVGKIKKAL
jgi:two-component system response regulator FlrC